MPHSDLAVLAQSLVHDTAVPVLSAGYTDLVARLRANEALKRLVAEKGLSSVLDSDSPELASLRKKNKEVVTGQEKEAERLMAARVKAEFPAHAIVGEEHGYTPGSQTRWVFDPIDGTSAMIRTAMAEAYGVPVGEPSPSFGVTVGVVEGDKAVLGVVVELRPQGGGLKAVATWVGREGQPSTCNGAVIGLLPSPATLSNARLACTVPEIMFNTAEKWGGFQALQDATGQPCVTDQNCVGFMRLCEPQSGISLVFEGDLGYHDVAALVPILQGCRLGVTDDRGGDLTFPESSINQEFRILAAPLSLHALALEKIRTGVPAEANTFQKGIGIQQGYAQKFPLAP